MEISDLRRFFLCNKMAKTGQILDIKVSKMLTTEKQVFLAIGEDKNPPKIFGGGAGGFFLFYGENKCVQLSGGLVAKLIRKNIAFPNTYYRVDTDRLKEYKVIAPKPKKKEAMSRK